MKKLIVILYNIRSTYNVGAILRTCDCLGIDEVVFSGYTPLLDKGLPHEQAKLKKQIHKTALGAEEFLKWHRTEDIFAEIELQKSNGQKIVALEQGEASINLADGDEFSENMTLILGEEVHGIPSEILEKCDCLLEIPMCGAKESFNVSVATGIALFMLRKNELNGSRKFLRTQK
jgi:tRNA G18 (ribose-2'-O)-methylase SpoU